MPCAVFAHAEHDPVEKALARMLRSAPPVSTFRPLSPLFDVSDTPPARPRPAAPAAVDRWTELADDFDRADVGFDGLLSSQWRAASGVHWTPAHVVRYATLLLSPAANEKVLDVGSGVGKFCILGALGARGTFVGVEQRPHLVAAAELAALQLGATNARFVIGDALDLDWSEYGCLYFFNPFIENKFPDDDRLDDSIPFGIDRYNDCLSRTAAKLSAMPRGTRVCVYYALGTPMPAEYQLLWEEWMGEGKLQLWLRL